MPVVSPCTAGRALLLVGLTVGGCSPEVLIASNDDPVGGAGMAGLAGTAGVAGMAGAGGNGGSEPVPSEAGQGGAATTPETPRILADSVADFSLVQGQRGWYYGYDDGTSAAYTAMTLSDVIKDYMPMTGDRWDCWIIDRQQWTQIFRLGAHSNGTDTSTPALKVLQRAVRRWLSTYEGEVKISGEIAKIDVAEMGSNGVEAFVVVDGVELGGWFVGGEDAGGWSYAVTTHVNVNSTVDFVLDPFESDDHHDLTRFTGIIERVDVP